MLKRLGVNGLKSEVQECGKVAGKRKILRNVAVQRRLTCRWGFSTTKVSAPMMRPASIQYRAVLPLNKKAAAMMANAQITDHTMGDATSFLEAGLIINIVARLCRPSRVKSN